jgi:hypothetical protein
MTKGIDMAATISSGDTVEGIARVVQAKDGVIWLEPEQTTKLWRLRRRRTVRQQGHR